MSEGYVSFLKAPYYYFRQAFDFKGRTSRSGYWWMSLWSIILAVVYAVVVTRLGLNTRFMAIGLVEGLRHGYYPVLVTALIQFILIVPDTALFVRRCRDARGWITFAYIMGIWSVVNIFIPDSVLVPLPLIGRIYFLVYFVAGLYALYIGIRPSQVVAPDGRGTVNQ